MVVRSGFEVQLVYADTKLPFKEHEKDGETYVEVEPDAEYFISIRRVSMEGHPAILSFYRVDGKDLGYRQSHMKISSNASYQGLWSRIDKKETNKALRFAKPKSTADENGKQYTEDTGSVVIALYQAIDKGSKPISDAITSFEPVGSTVNATSETACKKKFLLTTQGEITLVTELDGTLMRDYEKCALIERITLHYCSALGLVVAGVIPKPDDWTRLRMERPVQPGQETATFKRMRHPIEDKVIEVVDLTDEADLPRFTW